MQTVMILLVESGLVFFIIHVCHFIPLLICARKILKVLTVLTGVVYGFGA